MWRRVSNATVNVVALQFTVKVLIYICACIYKYAYVYACKHACALTPQSMFYICLTVVARLHYARIQYYLCTHTHSETHAYMPLLVKDFTEGGLLPALDTMNCCCYTYLLCFCIKLSICTHAHTHIYTQKMIYLAFIICILLHIKFSVLWLCWAVLSSAVPLWFCVCVCVCVCVGLSTSCVRNFRVAINSFGYFFFKRCRIRALTHSLISRFLFWLCNYF